MQQLDIYDNGEPIWVLNYPPLLKRFRYIFGNFITKVYILSYSYYNKEDSKNYFNNIKKEYELDKKTKNIPNHLRWDGYEFLLEFKNGNKVIMFNSEWASFTKI